MRFDLLAAPRLVCAAALLLASCTRTLDFDDLSAEGSNVDTEVGDTPTGRDGGIDAPTAATDDPPLRDGGGIDAGFCASLTPKPTFCDDFDTLPLSNLWDEITVNPADGGTLDHQGDDALSPTNALLASVRPGIPADSYVALVARKSFSELGPRASRVAIDFDMRIEQFDPTPERDVVAFQLVLGALAPGSLRNQLALNVVSDGAQVRTRFNENLLTSQGVASMSATHEASVGPSVNRWTHVSLEFDIQEPTGSNNHARVRMGPAETFETDAVTLYRGQLAYALHEGRPLMEIGLPWVNTGGDTSAWRIRYDNFLVRISFK